MSGIAALSSSSGCSAMCPLVADAEKIRSSAIAFLKVARDGCPRIQQNLDAICSSKEFVQNPKDALVHWLIHGCEYANWGGGPEEQALLCIMYSIPDFEKAVTIKSLTTLGESYFPQIADKNRLKEWLQQPFVQSNLTGFNSYYTSAKSPEQDPVRSLTYLSSAKNALNQVLQIFRLTDLSDIHHSIPSEGNEGF